MKKLTAKGLAFIKRAVFNLIKAGEKAPAEQDIPVRSPEELKAEADRLKLLLQSRPEDVEALYKLGEVYVEMARFGEAIAPLKEAVRLDPEPRAACFLLGRACLEVGRDEEAIAALDEAGRMGAESEALKKLLAQAHTNLSISLGRMGNHREAFKEIKKAIQIIPNFGPAHLSMGVCYEEMGRYQEAMSKFDTALMMDARLIVDANYHYGLVYTKLKDYKKAIKHYQRAIAESPTAAKPNLRLGLLYTKLKRYGEAIPFLEMALKRSPKLSPEAHYQLGLAYTTLNRYSDAVEPLRRAQKENPDNEKILSMLAESLYQTSLTLNKPKEPEPENLEVYEQEVALLREAVFCNPRHSLAQYSLGRAYHCLALGYKALVHTVMAKQLFAQEHNDEWLGRTMKDLQFFYKKYGYKPEEFAKIKVPGS